MAKEVLVSIRVESGQALTSIDSVNKSFKQLEGTTNRMRKQAKKNPKATAGIDNAILMETSRLASDASYGFTAIANNLGQLINLFKMSKDATGSFTASLSRLFTVQGMFLVGIQLLIAFFPKILKLFGEGTEETLKYSKAIREATASVKDHEISIRALQGAIDDGNLSYSERTRMVEDLKKKTGLSNIELDSSNKLTKESNNLIDLSIKKTVLEAKAKAILGLIEANNKEALKEIAEIREKESGSVNKFFTLLKTFVQPVIDTFNTFKKSVSDFFNSPAFKYISWFSPVIKGAMIAVEKYGEAVDSAEQKEKRSEKTKKKISEVQERINKSNSKYQEQLKQLNIQIGELNLVEGDNNDIKEKQSYLIDQNTQKQLDAIDREINAIKQLGKIRELYSKKNNDRIFKDKETRLGQIEAENESAINAIKALGLTEAQTSLARNEVNAFYTKERVDAEKEALFELGEAIILVAGEGSDVGKATAAAMAIVNTYQGMTKAFAEVKPPFSYVLAATTALKGFAAVRNILAVDPKNPKVPSTSGAGGGVQVAAPEFNVVGASGTSQLAQTIGGLNQQPIKAFVVGKDITTQQELDRNIVNTAGI